MLSVVQKPHENKNMVWWAFQSVKSHRAQVIWYLLNVWTSHSVLAVFTGQPRGRGKWINLPQGQGLTLQWVSQKFCWKFKHSWQFIEDVKEGLRLRMSLVSGFLSTALYLYSQWIKTTPYSILIYMNTYWLSLDFW